MPDFSGAAGAGPSTDLIPHGQLAAAVLTVRGVKDSKDINPKTGQRGRYLDCELTILDGQPFARRKVWTRIQDPTHGGNTPEGNQAGMAQIGRILECGRFGIKEGFNQQAFQAAGGYVTQDPQYGELNGLTVAIKIKIEKGTNGYADKNDIAEFLSPNPASASFATLQRLMRGEYGGTAQPQRPAAQGSFGFGQQAPAPQQPAAAPGRFAGASGQPAGFPGAAPAPNATQAAPASFQQQAPAAGPFAQQGAPSAGGFAPPPASQAPAGATAHPSNSWVKQANPGA
jgi:hypothetical protein